MAVAITGAFSKNVNADVKTVPIANGDLSELPKTASDALPGWRSCPFFETPVPTRTIEKGGRSFVRFQFSNGNARNEAIWSLGQQITAKPGAGDEFRITIKYRATQDIPLYVGITAGQGCGLPYLRAQLPTATDGSDWLTTTVNLSAFRFQPSNVIWNGSLWLEIFTVGRPKAFPAVVDLQDIKVAIAPSSVGILPVSESELQLITKLQSQVVSVSSSDTRDRLWISKVRADFKKLAADFKAGAQVNAAQRDQLIVFSKWAASIVESVPKGDIRRLKRMVVFEVNPLSNLQILPSSRFFDGGIAKEICAKSARGTTVPVGLVVSAEAKLEQLLLSVEPFRDATGQIVPDIGVDRKLVKCWYQDQNENWRLHPPGLTLPPPSDRAIPVNTDPQSYQYSPLERTGLKILTPELLLNDDGLVVVDASTRSNSVRTTSAGGARLVRVDDPKAPAATTITDFQVNDSPELLPVSVAEGCNQQFWLDIQVPATTKPGAYSTKIQWRDGDQVLGETPLTIEVLPTVLPSIDFIASLFYHPVNYTNEPGYPVFYPGESAWEQTARELKSLAANNVWDVLTPGPKQNVGVDSDIDVADLQRRVEMRKAAGLRTDRLFYTGIMLGRINSPGQGENLRKRIRLLVETAKSLGVKEVYVYSLDEANAEALAALRSAWVIAHEEGARIFAAGAREDMFPLMGDKLDLFICAGYPDRREAARWHANDKKIACYTNPQGGLEQPETYRRNYGILLWQNDYDGAVPYTFHTGGRQSIGSVPSVWNDYIENPDSMKQLAMVYPTASGVIETIQMRGLREAYTDLQYLHALEMAVNEKAFSAADQTKAAEWLHALKSGDINKDQVDPVQIRADIIAMLSHSTRSNFDEQH